MADAIMADVADSGVSLRPRFKISELPLHKDQRSAIDSLLLKFKKQGGYDTLRKQVWESCNTSEAKTALTEQIYGVAEKEIDKDPNLLSRDRGKAATLIHGALDRSGIYSDVEARIDNEIAKHLDVVVDVVREIRKVDVGGEQAVEEAQRGSKTDEEYRAETEARAGQRNAARARMEELNRSLAEMKAKIRASEDKKKREEQAKRDEEERKRNEAEDEKRRKERRRRQEEEERREAERIKARDERARKREEERKDREKKYEEEREERHRARDRERSQRSLSRRNSVAEAPKEVEEKDLEAAALESLLNEGRQMTEKAKPKPFDFEKGDVEDQRRRRDRSKESRRQSKSRGRTSLARDETRESAVKRDESNDREEGEAGSPQVAGGTPIKAVDAAAATAVARDRRPRSASPLGIDRYVPGGGVHRSLGERERDKDRKKFRENDIDRPRERKYEKSEGRDERTDVRKDVRRSDKRDDRRDDRKDKDRDYVRRGDREREKYRDRSRDHDRDRERRRSRTRSPKRRDRDERRDDRDYSRRERDDRRDDRRDGRPRDRDRGDRRDRDKDRDRRDRERDRDVDRYKPRRERE